MCYAAAVAASWLSPACGAGHLRTGASAQHRVVGLFRPFNRATASPAATAARVVQLRRSSTGIVVRAKKAQNSGDDSSSKEKGAKQKKKKQEETATILEDLARLRANSSSTNGNGKNGKAASNGGGKNGKNGGSSGDHEDLLPLTGSMADIVGTTTRLPKIQKPKTFDPTTRVPVEVNPQELERAALRAQRDFVYEKSLGLLQIELVKLCEWVRHRNLKVLVVFEGRDTAGKGGVISRIASAVPTRVCRVVALPAPTERQRTQWYFQRYVEQLPAGGELVLFDRSYYNRCGVERVMGFATEAEVELFFREVGSFEHSLTAQGIQVIKFWLDVSDDEQDRRIQARLRHSWKRWKLSAIDLCARTKAVQYLRARDEMLARTDFPWARWWVVPSDDKQASRLNCIQHLLASVPFENVAPEPTELPKREKSGEYRPPPKSAWNVVCQLYSPAVLRPPVEDLIRAAALETAHVAGAVVHERMEDAEADEYLGPE